jgi:hypothetical protein
VPKPKTPTPDDFEPTSFNDDELDQIVTEAWRRIGPLRPAQRAKVVGRLRSMYEAQIHAEATVDG